MSMFLDTSAIIWDRFGGLEPREDKWAGDKGFWESFNTAFFASNGMVYDPAKDSNVETWVTAEDRAPYINMAAELLPRLAERHDLSGVDMVILAHWLPDLHLGSSVTNYAMHLLGLDNARGFAISDRGVSAPFFALDVIHKCMKNHKVKKALLLVMDQKHLLYRSALVDELKPENSGLVMLLNCEAHGGHAFAGYGRQLLTKDDDIALHLKRMAAELGIDLRTARVIADEKVLAHLDDGISRVAVDPAMICAAPFCTLEKQTCWAGSFLLGCLHEDSLSVVGFTPSEDRHAD